MEQSKTLATMSPERQLVAKTIATLGSVNTRLTYGRALNSFLNWSGDRTFGYATVTAYATSLREKGLAKATINIHLAAIKLLAEMATGLGALDATVLASVKAVRVTRGGSDGHRTGHWLTSEQIKAARCSPDETTLVGVRDKLILGLTLGCGLRRAEVASIDVGQMIQLNGRLVVSNLIGKGEKLRTVPVPLAVAKDYDAWMMASNISEGRVLRRVRDGRAYGSGLTTQTIYDIVRKHTGVSPHDLRRSFARGVFEAGASLEQIQITLGHSSVKTTERYVSARQDISQAPCDLLEI